jgi:hypothetical protein
MHMECFLQYQNFFYQMTAFLFFLIKVIILSAFEKDAKQICELKILPYKAKQTSCNLKTLLPLLR